MLAMIIAAAAVASAPAPQVPTPYILGSPEAGAFRGPFAASAACKATGRYQTDWEPALMYRPQDRIRPRRLEALPKPDYEKTVMRTIDGCSAPLIVGTSVGR